MKKNIVFDENIEIVVVLSALRTLTRTPHYTETAVEVVSKRNAPNGQTYQEQKILNGSYYANVQIGD